MSTETTGGRSRVRTEGVKKLMRYTIVIEKKQQPDSGACESGVARPCPSVPAT